MSAEDATLYKYSVPLETVDGADAPAYEATYSDTILVNRYTGTHLVIVQDESIPHFHRDSVNVQVEEVDGAEYDYEPSEEEGDTEE